MEDWQILKRFFPAGWQRQARESGALYRQRKITSAEQLLRVLLIHLVDGCSLRETVARAAQGGLASISDVALLKRLKASSEWLRWMSLSMLRRRGIVVGPPSWLKPWNVRCIDGTFVSEPGSTGTDWRVHYSLRLFDLHCDDFIVTGREQGESFTRFSVSPGDLLIGDRYYGRLRGMRHVLDGGGDYLVRLRSKAFGLYAPGGLSFDVARQLRALSVGQIGQWHLHSRGNDRRRLAVRLCAICKSDEAAQRAMKRATYERERKALPVDATTIELQRYVVLATSLPENISTEQVLQLYRLRWQIEVAFKRLKSIIGLGHLPKIDNESARAWLHGKILVALLAQAIVDEGRFFSPWGYPIA